MRPFIVIFLSNITFFLIEVLNNSEKPPVIINLIKKETGKSYKVVITGGFSDLFKNSIKTKVIENKDITVKGLIKISKLLNR